jgi:hypothetical protein
MSTTTTTPQKREPPPLDLKPVKKAKPTLQVKPPKPPKPPKEFRVLSLQSTPYSVMAEAMTLLETLPKNVIACMNDLSEMRECQCDTLAEKKQFNRFILDRDAFLKKLQAEKDDVTRREMQERRQQRLEKVQEKEEKYSNNKLTHVNLPFPTAGTCPLPTLQRKQRKRFYVDWDGTTHYVQGKGWEVQRGGILKWSQKDHNPIYLDMRYGNSVTPRSGNHVLSMNHPIAAGLDRLYVYKSESGTIIKSCKWKVGTSSYDVKYCTCNQQVYVLDVNFNHTCEKHPILHLNFKYTTCVEVMYRGVKVETFHLSLDSCCYVRDGTKLWYYHDGEMLDKAQLDFEELNNYRLALLNKGRKTLWRTGDWWPQKKNIAGQMRLQKPVAVLPDDILREKILPFISYFAACGIT